MKLATTLLSILPLVLATGCASAPTAAELEQADYGSPITQEDAEAQATAWLQSVLRDPESLRVSWDPLLKGWRNHFGETYFGYRLPATVNAKNGFGGYSGAEPYEFMFFNGRLAHVWKPSDGGYFMQKVK